MDWLEKAIEEQRTYIECMLVDSFSEIAARCVKRWGDRKILDATLKNHIASKKQHSCQLLYAIDKQGIQVSSNISDAESDDTIVGQDLSSRPYLKNLGDNDFEKFVLSDVYIDQKTRKPCITALHSVNKEDQIIGYIAADFDLGALPLKDIDKSKLHKWRQIKGDPSIRGTLFQQTRTASAMDEHIDEVLDVVESLITERGIFHAKLHFSSSRATLWPYDDPYHYRIHVLDEIINPKVCLVYSRMLYPEDAVVPITRIPEILKMFKLLREADETIYLRAASINIMNGLVGLNFSCDGSHYMPAEEFLHKDISFWFGPTKDKSLCVIQ